MLQIGGQSGSQGAEIKIKRHHADGECMWRGGTGEVEEKKLKKKKSKSGI